MSWGKHLLLFLSLTLLLGSMLSEIISANCSVRSHYLESKAEFLPPGNHEVYLDLQVLSVEEVKVVLTFKAMDQFSWFLISSLYAQQRANLASDLEKFIADSLWIDPSEVRRRGIEIDVNNWKIWLTADVNLSNSTSITKKGREFQICIRDPIYEGLYEGARGWIDQINVTVVEGFKIICTSPGESIVNYTENNVLWVIPSMEKASPTYCINIKTEGFALPSWLIVVISFVIIGMLYLVLSKKLRKTSPEPFLPI